MQGLLNCPLNESISYDPKTGFHLVRADFEDPRGKYICSAAYNNTIRYIEFDLVSPDFDSGSPGNINSPAMEQAQGQGQESTLLVMLTTEYIY